MIALAAIAPTPSVARAQDAQSSRPVAEAKADALGFVVPALTVVTLEIRSALGSKLSKPGDIFLIRLVDPIMDGDRVIVPAGVTGAGEVVHAKKAGGSGTGGELVLAARYLDVCGRQLRLRSLHMAPNGRSKTDLVNALNVAGAAVGPIVAVTGLLIRGGEVDVAEGTLGVAKTAQPFTIEPAEGGAASGTGCPAG